MKHRRAALKTFDVIQRSCRVLVWIVLSVAASAQSTNAPSEKLAVLEATSEGIAAESLRSPSLALKLTLHNPSDVKVSKIRIEVANFHDASMRTYATTIATKTAGLSSIDAHKSESLELKATLPEAGRHSARLIITSSAKTLDVPIVVTRVAETVLVPPQPVPLKVSPFGGAEFTQDLIIQRAAGADSTVTVRARKFEYAPKDTVKVAVPLESTTLAQNVAVVAGQDSKVPIKVPVPHAGTFNLELEYQLANSPAATTSVAIYAREGFGIAILFILLGFLLATALRFIVTELRPKSAGAQRIVACRERLQRLAAATTDPTARATIERVASQLQTQWNEFLSAQPTAAENSLTTAERKVNLLAAWLQVRALLPVGLPEKVRVEADKKLGEIQNVLDSSYAQVAEMDEHLKALGTMPSEVNKQALEYSATALADLAAHLAQFSSDEATRIREDATALSEQFAKASANDLASLFENLNLLRVRYVRLMSADLRMQVEGESPVEMNAAAWLRIRARTTKELNECDKLKSADLLSARYLIAVRTYVHPVLSHLMRILASRIATDDASKLQYEDLFKRATTLRDHIDTEQLSDALDTLSLLIRDFDDIEYGGFDLLDTGGLANFINRPPQKIESAPRQAGEFLQFPSFQWMPDRVSDLGDSSRAAARTHGLTILAGLLALAITVLLGVQTLWSTDYSWGGANAYLIAILWGAGVYGLSFEGLNSLLSRFKKE